MRHLEERILIESLTQPTDMDELRREIVTDRKVERIQIQPARQSNVYTPQGRIRIPVKRIEDEKEIIVPSKPKKEVKNDPQVIHAFAEVDELRKLIDKPLSEIYEREVSDKPKNKFMPIRKLSEFLENSEFDANELALLSKLVQQIVKFNKGSIERVLACLYIESELSKKYQL